MNIVDVFRDEFFSEFSGMSNDILEEGINLLTSKEYERLINFYGKKSLKNVNSDNPQKIINVLREIINKYVIKKNIYVHFLSYSQDRVDMVFYNLRSNTKSLVLKVFTFSQEYEMREKLSNKEKSTLRYVLSAMKANLDRNEYDYHYLGIFDRSNEDRDLVRKVILSLTTDEQDLLKKRFGDDYNSKKPVKHLTSTETKIINERLIRKISKLIQSYKAGEYRFVTISELFDGKSIDEIKEVVVKLGELSYYENVFDKDFKRVILVKSNNLNSSFHKSNYEKVYKEMFKFTRIYLKKPFYQLFIKYMMPGEKLENFVYRVNTLVNTHLNSEQLGVLHIIYGEYYDKVINFGQYKSKDIKAVFLNAYSLINYYLAKQLNKYEINIHEEITRVCEELCNTQEYKELLTFYSANQALAIMLLNSQKFSVDDISEYTGVSLIDLLSLKDQNKRNLGLRR